MKKKLSAVLVAAAVLSGALSAPAATDAPLKKVVLCCEERDWYPFIYAEGDEVRGMHIDIVREAARRAGFEATFTMFPLQRCLKMAQHNDVDGMVSIAYDKKYAPHFEYPPNTPNVQESAWRIMQVDDVVVTAADNPFELNGGMRSLPQPVRVVKDDSIIPALSQAELAVEETATDRQNFAKLVRDKTGCLITSSVRAGALCQDDAFRDKVKISASPLRSQSYFLAFSWGTGLSADDKKRIWDEIENTRKDYIFMLGVFAQY